MTLNSTCFPDGNVLTALGHCEGWAQGSAGDPGVAQTWPRARSRSWSGAATVNCEHCPQCTVLGTEPLLLQHISVRSFKREASLFPSGIVVELYWIHLWHGEPLPLFSFEYQPHFRGKVCPLVAHVWEGELITLAPSPGCALSPALLSVRWICCKHNCGGVPRWEHSICSMKNVALMNTNCLQTNTTAALNEKKKVIFFLFKTVKLLRFDRNMICFSKSLIM